jgi:hypothetical protein
MRIQKMIPALVLAAIAVLMLALYLPGYLRYHSFTSDLGKFISTVKKGDAIAAAGFVDDVDYDSLVQLIDMYVPQDYAQDLKALNVSSVAKEGKEYVSLLVVRFQGKSYNGVGQARIRWHRTKKGWRFALREAEVAEGYPEGNFVSLDSYLGGSDLFRPGVGVGD